MRSGWHVSSAPRRRSGRRSRASSGKKCTRSRWSRLSVRLSAPTHQHTLGSLDHGCVVCGVRCGVKRSPRLRRARRYSRAPSIPALTTCSIQSPHRSQFGHRLAGSKMTLETQRLARPRGPKVARTASVARACGGQALHTSGEVWRGPCSASKWPKAACGQAPGAAGAAAPSPRAVSNLPSARCRCLRVGGA